MKDQNAQNASLKKWMKKVPLGGDRGKARPPAKGAGEGNLKNRQGIQAEEENRQGQNGFSRRKGKDPQKGRNGSRQMEKGNRTARRDYSRQKARGKRGPSKRAEGVQGKSENGFKAKGNWGKGTAKGGGFKAKGKREPQNQGLKGFKGKRRPTLKKAKGKREKGTAKGGWDSRQKGEERREPPRAEGIQGKREGEGQRHPRKGQKGRPTL